MKAKALLVVLVLALSAVVFSGCQETNRNISNKHCEDVIRAEAQM